MRLDQLPKSENIEDRRGGLSGLPGGRGGLGIGTVIVLALIGWALGIDPRFLIGGADVITGGSETQTGAPVNKGAPGDAMGEFVSAIVGSTEAEWTDIFAQ